MSLEKNQEYEITIDDFGSEGEGIGHIDGMAVFVKDAAPMDVARIKIIKVKKNYAYGRLMEIIKPSPYRVDMICPHGKRCGGCQIMHVSYEEQLKWKQDKVLNCLKRIGGMADAKDKMEPIIGMDTMVGMTDENEKNVDNDDRIMDVTGNDNCEKMTGLPPYLRYRNKAQFPVRRDKNGKVVIGFYAGRTHDVIDTDVCYLQDAVNDEIIRRFRAFMEEYQVETYDEENHRGLVRHILTRIGRKTGEVMVCVIINGNELIGVVPDKRDRDKNADRNILENINEKERGVKSEGKRLQKVCNIERELVDCLAGIRGMTSISINVNKEKTNRILGDTCRTLWGRDTITDYIGDVKYQINPLSFYQVNPVQTEKLYGKALEYAGLRGDETVWDLYCGIGTISLFLAQKAKKVYGVEIVPEAIEDARMNGKLNGFDNVEFFVGKAEEVLPREYEKHGVYADVIVVDPPRKGCDIVAINTMLQMKPKRIVYVSCDPATLARDVKLLCEGGYELTKWCATDMFPMSGHVETVVLMSKKDK